MVLSGRGRVRHAGGCPVVSSGIVSTAGVERRARPPVTTAPNDHLAAGPHCRLVDSTHWRIGGARGCPTISARKVSPAGVRKVSVLVVDKNSAPNDHFAAGPDRCRPTSRRRCVSRTSLCPVIGHWIVSPAGIQLPIAVIMSAPDDHLDASPHCRVKISTHRRIDSGGVPPSIRTVI